MLTIEQVREILADWAMPYLLCSYGNTFPDKKVAVLRKMCEQSIAAAARRIVEAQGEWVSVKDRLPIVRDQYLCLLDAPDNDGGWNYAAAKWFGKPDGWVIPGIGGLRVTHWMPLPDTPAASDTAEGKE